MIALWIIGGIILIIIILLNCPANAFLEYYNEAFNISVKYLFFTIYPAKEKPEKVKEKKKINKIKAQKNSNNISKRKNTPPLQKEVIDEEKELTSIPKSNSENDIKNENEKESLVNKKDEIFEKIAFFKTILQSSKKGLRRIVKGIYISDILLNFIVANEDAYDAAIDYGKVNMITYNAISFLRVFFTISIKKIDISCKFNSSDSSYNGKCNVKLRPATLLLAAISIFYHYVINNNRNKKEALKENLQSAN